VVPVAVNVSPVQLKSCGVWDRMRQILCEEGVQPKQLALELTESALMENVSQLRVDLQSLRSEGVAIEIDDFGTGYSSLSCLKQLPLDSIKIDRSFITHLETSETDRAIVEAILAMARSLRLRVVAEGVESVGQLQVLGRYGCEIAQGYYFSPPMGAQECEELLIDLAARKSFTDTLRLGQRTSARVCAAPAPTPAAAPNEDSRKKYIQSI
jgi:EAL domain-containing protein (putative c-di-GMP-specific phosphodiesterase class I)